MTNAELCAAIQANEHQHALDGVARIRFRILEEKLARAVEARLTAERKLHEHICDELDELNRAKAENRRLQRELDVMSRALSLAAQTTVQPTQAVEPNPPRPYQRPGGKGLPRKSSSAIRHSDLVQRALRGEPLPEPPEPGTFDPTIEEEEG